jgi:hypothetical protein
MEVRETIPLPVEWVDLFVFDTGLNAATNKDTLTDFTHDQDTISLDLDIFTKLAIGTLDPANFLSNATKAADAKDYIVYNTATGDLVSDVDGSPGPARTSSSHKHIRVIIVRWLYLEHLDIFHIVLIFRLK